MAQTRERLQQPGLLGPARAELERNLANGPILVDGMAELFTRYGIAGFAEAHAKLKQQLGAYQDFVRKELLPRARGDFRLPPPYYAFRLQRVGVDIAPEKLRALAHAAFTQIQAEMQALAPAVAKQHGFKASDYREVIRALKKEQLVGEAIMPHYRKRLGEIRGDRAAPEAGQPAGTTRAHPPGERGRDRRLARAAHASPAAAQQPRRAGRVRAAAQYSCARACACAAGACCGRSGGQTRRGQAQVRRLHLHRGLVEPDRA